MIVAAEQPALCLGYFEDGFGNNNSQVSTFDQHETTAHREAIDGGDHRLLQGAGHERVLDRRPFAPCAPACSDSFMSSPAQKPRPLPVKMATSCSLLWRYPV